MTAHHWHAGTCSLSGCSLSIADQSRLGQRPSLEARCDERVPSHSVNQWSTDVMVFVAEGEQGTGLRQAHCLTSPASPHITTAGLPCSALAALAAAAAGSLPEYCGQWPPGLHPRPGTLAVTSASVPPVRVNIGGCGPTVCTAAVPLLHPGKWYAQHGQLPCLQCRQQHSRFAGVQGPCAPWSSIHSLCGSQC